MLGHGENPERAVLWGKPAFYKQFRNGAQGYSTCFAYMRTWALSLETHTHTLFLRGHTQEHPGVAPSPALGS